MTIYLSTKGNYIEELMSVVKPGREIPGSICFLNSLIYLLVIVIIASLSNFLVKITNFIRETYVYNLSRHYANLCTFAYMYQWTEMIGLVKQDKSNVFHQYKIGFALTIQNIKRALGFELSVRFLRLNFISLSFVTLNSR